MTRKNLHKRKKKEDCSVFYDYFHRVTFCYTSSRLGQDMRMLVYKSKPYIGWMQQVRADRQQSRAGQQGN